MFQLKKPFETRSSNLFGELEANPKRIRQARELSGLTQSELADKIGVSQGLIAHFEGSFKTAGREVIQRIAQHTRRFQRAFFYTEPLVELPPGAVLFRAAASMTRTEEMEARRYTEIACEMACILLDHIKPLPFALSIDSRVGPAEAARRARSLLGVLPDQPIPHLIRLIEKSGVLVLSAPMELPKREALSVRSNQVGMPVIAVFGNSTGDRVRLSAAHELGHIVLKHSSTVRSIEEQQAYGFAAELLMPETAMHREMTQPVTLSSLATLKPRWRVSIQALIYRGRELRILDESRSRYLYTQISVKGWRKNEPIEIPVERPRLMRQLFERVYRENYETLANDVGLRSEFVREIMECYEGKAAEEKCYPKVASQRRR
jgi:Zn-dependent peptidase ImmA (M78 family)/transcriptional regulator with XRE-family HTH domain